jgi:hypothetical protein
MAKNAEAPKAETIEKVVSVFKKTESISKTALQTEISTTKVRKILITEGLWLSARSQQIRELADQGKSSSEIAGDLQINVTMVQNYLPYEKGLYDEPEKTDTAIRSEKYRKRNRTYAQKSRAREQQTIDGLAAVQKTAAPGEKKKTPFAMQLHLELRNSRLDSLQAEEAKILAKYGAVAESISRDVIVPSSLALHQLHYLINMAFGWTNSHLHNYLLPLPLFQALTTGKFLEIAPVFGYYLKFPNSIFNDEFWDDDYDEFKSPRTWMRSKYLKQYAYRGYSDYWLENQVEIHDLANQLPILDVHPFSWKEEVKSRKVKFEDAALQDLLDAVIFDEGRPDALKESLRLSEILSMNPEDIESAKAAALSTDNSSVLLYKQYRDTAITEAKRKEGSRDMSVYFHAARQMERLQKKSEPNEIMPISAELLYCYDFGDGWEVDISLVREFGKNNQIADDETAAKVIANCKPICIAKDGLNVLDDCGNVPGYIEMLRTIHEGDRNEAKEMREWARSLGWTGRNVSSKNMI